MTASPLERVLAELERVTRDTPRGAGDQLNARCPAHDDERASLSVKRTEDDTVLLKCHRGCTVDEILSRLDLNAADLFVSTTNNNGARSVEYRYCDEDGHELFQAVRFTPKGFAQRHYDPTHPEAKSDGYVWNLKGCRLVLFHLPRVLKAVEAGEVIYITEGEKDVAAIERAGGVATCNPMGAGKWRPEYSETLRGAHVVVVADRDEPGYRHAEEVRSSLDGVASSVVVVEAADGNDAADHLSRRLGLEDFVPVEVGAKRETETRTGYARSMICWDTFWKVDRSERDWYVEPLFVNGRAHSIVSRAKDGKSLLLLEVAAKLATGEAVLNRPAGEPVEVLYLDYEMTEDDLHERLLDMGFDETKDLKHLHYALLPSVLPLDTELGGDMLLAEVERIGARFVVIDTTGRATRGKENEADTIQDFYRHTGRRLKAADVTSVRLDHLGKDTTLGARGSSAKNDDVDVVWQLSRGDGGVTLTATHRRLDWVPEKVSLGITEDPLRHVPAAAVWPAGTAEVARLLDEAGVPDGARRRDARAMLKAAGLTPGRDIVLGAALRWRQDADRRCGD